MSNFMQSHNCNCDNRSWALNDYPLAEQYERHDEGYVNGWQYWDYNDTEMENEKYMGLPRESIGEFTEANY